jgi:hypothetical protein
MVVTGLNSIRQRGTAHGIQLVLTHKVVIYLLDP